MSPDIPDIPDIDVRLAVALEVSREAAELAKSLFLTRKPGTFSMKGTQDFLTEADGQVERLIAERLGAAFPDDTFVGEEGGGTFSERTWVVDPIDGTANFARGIPHFSISIGLIADGRPSVGVICDPIVGETFAAAHGRGATLNGKPIHVAETTDPRTATVELGWSTRLPLAEYVAMVGRVMEKGAGVARCGSGALGLAYVAAGRIDGYAELHINSWDVMAGIVLVEEAGGWVNDFLANDGLRKGNAILACPSGMRAMLSATTGIAD